jgi:hypothetical protein
MTPARGWDYKTRCVYVRVRSFGERFLALRDSSSDPKIGAGGARRDRPPSRAMVGGE